MIKKIISLIVSAAVLLGLSACSSDSKPKEAVAQQPVTSAVNVDTSKVDYDIASLNTTMAYSQVMNMQTNPDEFIGKVVRMKGNFAHLYVEETNTTYYTLMIADATACCNAQLEFVLGNDYVYPNDFPSENQEATVTGVFETYYEGETRYAHLVCNTIDF